MNFGNQNQPMHLYQNPGYNFERRKRQTLILDIDDSTETHLGTGGEFSVELFEPLLIDKDSEIYLDNFISFNSNIAGVGDDSAFCLTINEFNIQTNVATNSSDKGQHHFNKLIIPNEHSSVDTYFGAVVHKGKKYNYVCDINPGKIGRISGKITNLAGNPIFHHQGVNTHTYALIGITSWNKTGGSPRALKLGESVTIEGPVSKKIDNQPITVTILANTNVDSPTILFSHSGTSGTLKEAQFVHNTLTITASNTNYIFTVGDASTGNVSLIQAPGRFIAEFTIVSKD